MGQALSLLSPSERHEQIGQAKNWLALTMALRCKNKEQAHSEHAHIEQLRLHFEDRTYSVELMAQLMEFANNYTNSINADDRNTLKLISHSAINDLYKYSSTVKTLDNISDVYLRSAVKSIFDELGKKNIYALFIIDNEMAEDRREGFKRIYSEAGFEVIDEPRQEDDFVSCLQEKLQSNKNRLILIQNYEFDQDSLGRLFNFLSGYANENCVVGYKSSGSDDTKSYAWGITYPEAQTADNFE